MATGLYNTWLTIENPDLFNSYSVEMLKALQLALKTASNAADVVAVVLTGSGTRAFCSGGNAVDFARHYGGNTQEFRRFMRLFNDTVSAILACDKPVICRVNGMRSGGGQELGLACDLSVAQDLAVFGQGGPKYGGAMLGGVTDFLPPMIGAEEAIAAGVLCEPMSAHKARRLGMIAAVVPALKIEGNFVVNPAVITDCYADDSGEVVFGEHKQGDDLRRAREMIAAGTIDLSLLDARVNELCSKFLMMFPESLTKTLEAMRKPKLEAWNRNKADNRAWLAANMMGEAHAGFRAFADGTKKSGREIDFVALRQAQARGEPWTPGLIDALIPKAVSETSA